jgi:hypothetical protein
MREETCSFCGKTRQEVRRMIAGPNVFICNECLELCVQALAETPEPAASPRDDDLLVRMPDGTLHLFARDSDWMPFVHAGHPFEWSTGRGTIRAATSQLIVAVRRQDADGPCHAEAFAPDALPTQDVACTIAERWLSAAPVQHVAAPLQDLADVHPFRPDLTARLRRLAVEELRVLAAAVDRERRRREDDR